MLEGLALTRDPAVIQHLLDWTQPEKPERARCTAAASLGRMANDVESVRTQAVDRLIELVQAGSFRLKYTAVSALGSAGSPAGLPVLRSIHEGQSDGRVRRSAYEAIQRINKNNKAGGPTGQLRRDLDQLRDENKKLRSRVDVLEQMDSPS
jgi:aminopeptidase N